MGRPGSSGTTTGSGGMPPASHVFERGDVVVWDELAGTLHTTTVYEPPHMEGPRLLRKLPPGDGGGHWHARRKRRAAAANRRRR